MSRGNAWACFSHVEELWKKPLSLGPIESTANSAIFYCVFQIYKYTVAPVINPPIPRTLLSFEGSSLTVPCAYTGHPQPTPSWCRLDNNGNCVKSVPSSTCPDFTPMDDGQFTYVLVISNLQSCHSGGYQCSVHNTVDKATGQFQLTVQGTTLAVL